MRRKIIAPIVAALIIACAAPVLTAPPEGAGTPATQPDVRPRSRAIMEAIRLQRDTRKQWVDLLSTMHQVAQALEKSDPQSARAIAAAAQRAEEAFVANDMEKVIKLLETGLIIPADATQGVVVKKLREVLETLRSGGDDLLSRLEDLEKMGRMIEALQEVLKRQRELEHSSRMLTPAGIETLDKIAQLSKDVRAMQVSGEELMVRTRNLTFDPVSQQLGAAGRPLQGVIGRLDNLIKAVSDPFPSPDAMANNMVMTKDITAEAISARVSVKGMLNEAAIAQAIVGASAQADATAVETAMNKAVDELGKAAAALKKDKLQEVQVSAAEAQTFVKDATASLEKIGGRLKGTQPIIAVIQDLSKMASQVDTVARQIDQAAPTNEDAQVIANENKPKIAGLKPRGFFLGSPLAAPGAAKSKNTPPATRPAKNTIVLSALSAIRRYDRDSSATDQEANLDTLKKWSERLGEASTKIRGLRETPEYPRQQSQQMRIGAGLALLARDSMPQDTTAGATRPSSRPASQPASRLLPGECQAMLGKAADCAVIASDYLGDAKPADANREQREVIRLIEEVVSLMEANMARALSQLVEELKEQFIAYLERMVALQKQVLAETVQVWNKRQSDGTYKRSEQMSFVLLANLQGQISVDIDTMNKLMAEAVRSHALMSFPAIMPMIFKIVKADVAVAKQRLIEHNADEKTQQIQKDIIERLEGMMKAMRGSGDDTFRPAPQGGDNGMGNVPAGDVSRLAEIELLILTQHQINRRTEGLERLKASGKGDAAKIDAEFKDLTMQQTEITRSIETMLQEDLLIFDTGAWQK